MQQLLNAWTVEAYAKCARKPKAFKGRKVPFRYPKATGGRALNVACKLAKIDRDALV